jgi:hypothetical protein
MRNGSFLFFIITVVGNLSIGRQVHEKLFVLILESIECRAYGARILLRFPSPPGLG